MPPSAYASFSWGRADESWEHGVGADWEQLRALNMLERSSMDLNRPVPTCKSHVSAVQRSLRAIVHTEEVTGSIPVSPISAEGPLISKDQGPFGFMHIRQLGKPACGSRNGSQTGFQMVTRP